MTNFDDFIKENRKKHNTNLPQIPNNPYKMQIEVLHLEKHSLFNLFSRKPDTDKVSLHAKDLYEAVVE